jgi:hypothetical protein
VQDTPPTFFSGLYLSLNVYFGERCGAQVVEQRPGFARLEPQRSIRFVDQVLCLLVEKEVMAIKIRFEAEFFGEESQLYSGFVPGNL